nr:hypothetical protein Iba_chr02bCG13230 [Ipomoea batatas]
MDTKAWSQNWHAHPIRNFVPFYIFLRLLDYWPITPPKHFPPILNY